MFLFLSFAMVITSVMLFTNHEAISAIHSHKISKWRHLGLLHCIIMNNDIQHVIISVISTSPATFTLTHIPQKYLHCTRVSTVRS